MKKIIIFILIGLGIFFLVYNSINKPRCYPVHGIAISAMPDETIIDYISRLKPLIFGVTPSDESLRGKALKYMSEIDKSEYGFEFKSFYGSGDYDYLMNLDENNVEVIGYCPNNEDMSMNEFSKRIQSLKEKYPDREILIGPCVDLFEKVDNAKVKPDHLGFEIFEYNFDAYLDGEYDKMIKNAQQYRTYISIFITPSKDIISKYKLKKVLNRALKQNLIIGYVLSGNEKLFDFILEHQCSK